MATRPIVVLAICVGFFLILHALVPKAMALKNRNVDRFMMEGHRTHKKKNYIAQTANDKEMGGFENVVAYDVDPDRNPEELSAFIVDYANMIRDDVILLDKSVETRTRKRGNIKVKKFNQAIPDLPCSCEQINETKELGDDVFPRVVEIRTCAGQNTCRKPFVCQEIMYDLTILRKKRVFGSEINENEINFTIHPNLKPHWYPAQISISVGCTFKTDYVKVN